LKQTILVDSSLPDLFVTNFLKAANKRRLTMVFVTQTKLSLKLKKPEDYIVWVGSPYQALKNALHVLIATEPGNPFPAYWLQVKNLCEKQLGNTRTSEAELKKEQISVRKIVEAQRDEMPAEQVVMYA